MMKAGKQQQQYRYVTEHTGSDGLENLLLRSHVIMSHDHLKRALDLENGHTSTSINSMEIDERLLIMCSRIAVALIKEESTFIQLPFWWSQPLGGAWCFQIGSIRNSIN